MHIFNVKDPGLDSWRGIGIVREFCGNLRHAPLKAGEIYRDEARHETLHGLQDLVDANRARGSVTIVCPWAMEPRPTPNDDALDTCGKFPTRMPWYGEYKARMREWVAQFRGQSDVWIELMNEPFPPLKTEADAALWLPTMADMVDNLRGAGWDGIIVIPGSGWGQDEDMIERFGPKLLEGRHDLLFDIHVYSGWLKQPQAIPARCERLVASGLPVLFGELGPGEGDNSVRDPRPFLQAALANRFGVLAWGWGTWGARHPINLQLNDGTPNDVGNFQWGSSFQAFLAAPH